MKGEMKAGNSLSLSNANSLSLSEIKAANSLSMSNYCIFLLVLAVAR